MSPATTMSHPCDFDALGFQKSTVPGHTLTDDTVNRHNVLTKCSCGHLTFYFYPRQNGLANSRALKAWSDHLDTLNADPDEAFLIGSITTKRFHHELLVAPTTFNGLGPYIDGSGERHRTWISSSDARWLILRRTRSVKGTTWRYRIDQSWHKSKARAVAAAERLLSKAIADGEEVTGGHSLARSAPVAITAEFSAASLVERAIAACDTDDPKDAIGVLAELDALWDSLPILEGMRSKLQNRLRHKRSA